MIDTDLAAKTQILELTQIIEWNSNISLSESQQSFITFEGVDHKCRKFVTNIPNSSPKYFVSNIRH